MPFWIEGWIEVARSPHTAEQHAWSGVVKLNSLIDVADVDTERIFGLSKACVAGEISVVALAANRGVPPNPSQQVRRELEQIAEHEAVHGPGEIGGHTYAVWREIRDYGLAEPSELSQMKVPFSLARILEVEYGEDRVRFVIWFSW